MRPALPRATGKRASSAIDLDADGDVPPSPPRKIVRTSASIAPSHTPVLPIDATAAQPAPATGDRTPIGDFELPLDAKSFHTLHAPAFDVADTFSPDSNAGKEIRKPMLDLLYFKSFLVAPARKQLYDWLLDELPWYRVRYYVSA